MTVIEREFATSDVDVAVDALDQAFPGARLSVNDIAASFFYRQLFRGTESLHQVEQQLPARIQAVSAPLPVNVIAWTIAGEAVYGHRWVSADTAVFWTAERGPLQAKVDHADLRSVTVDAAVFRERASALLGREWTPPVDLVRAPAGETSAQLRRRLDQLASDALSPVVQAHPLLASAEFDAIVATVLTLFGMAGEPAPQHTTPRTVRRAVAFIDEHAGEPISLSDIAAAAGLSRRGLEYAFRQHLETTPTAYLRAVRLRAVRTELEGADPLTTTVAEVARRWGFGHLGRFAHEYRESYAETPSATLRR